ncbi:MAG: hypothetical protein HUJ26_08665 [Planctomycetaceae bacterium]|nr:hypothetical protein [Planctomycetaceae bacterium]
MMKYCLGLCLSLLVLTGCNNESVKEMSKGAPVVSFNELSDFENDALMAVSYPLEMGDVNAAKEAAKSETFTSQVDAIASASELGGASQSNVDAFVAAAKDVAAKADGSDDEFKAAVEKMNAALKTVKGG